MCHVLHGRPLDGSTGNGVERQSRVDVVDGVQDLKLMMKSVITEVLSKQYLKEKWFLIFLLHLIYDLSSL